MSEWSEEDIIRMEQFIEGKLSTEERIAFDRELLADAELQKKVSLLIELKEGIRYAGRKELLSEINQWEEKEPSVPTTTIPLWKRSWPIGIAALLLIGISLLLLWPRQENTDELFAMYFEPYPNVVMPTVRGAANLDTTTVQKAYRAYDMEDYASAASLFESAESKDESALLYLSNSYLALGEPEKAILILEGLASVSGQFEDEARWYLGLGYIKSNKPGEAKQIMQGLDSNVSYKERVSEIMNLLKP